MIKRFLNSSAVRIGLAGVAAWYLRLVRATTRWRVEGDAEIAAFAHGAPCIVAFWHETLPAMPIFWARAGTARPARVLASRHRDGRLIAMVVERLGIAVVSGSTSRGGAAGLRALLAALRSGAHVGLTPDGPRGPRRHAAPGIAMLAALSGARILPCAASVSAAVGLNSWDQMRFPLPFGRGRLVCGPLIGVGRADWQAAVPSIEAALTAVLLRARRP